MGLFGEQYLSNQSEYSDSERAHYTQVVNALSRWAAAAPLTDKQRAKTTITLLTATARTAGLSTDAELQAAGITAHLIGGADVAAELDAKRAIDQGSRLAATL